jgi:hypothetical protein
MRLRCGEIGVVAFRITGIRYEEEELRDGMEEEEDVWSKMLKRWR